MYKNLNKTLKKYKNKKILLWGASQYLKEGLETNKINITDNIIGIIDKNSNEKNIKNLKLYSPENIKNIEFDVIVSTIKNNSHENYKQIKKYVKSNFSEKIVASNIFKKLIIKEFLIKKFPFLDYVIKKLKYTYQLGYCPICKKPVIFIKKGNWLRDDFICSKCYSIPRQRAIINVIKKFYPDIKNLKVHESSPSGVTYEYFKKEINDYTISHYYPELKSGEININTNIQCQNIEKMSFENNTFDIFITQDVLEHIFNPEIALKEIERVLKPNGSFIFTVPMLFSMKKTIRRAKLENSNIIYLEDPVYHGNPISDEGSLVTFDYGADFIDLIKSSCNLKVYHINKKNYIKGIDGEYLDVFVLKKNG